MSGHEEAQPTAASPVIEKIPFFMQVEDDEPIKLLVPKGYVFSQYCDLAYNVYLQIKKQTKPVHIEPVQVTRFVKDNAMLVKFRLQGGNSELPTNVKEAIELHFNAEPLRNEINTKFGMSPPGRNDYLFTNIEIPTKCSPNRLIELLTDPKTTSNYSLNVFLLCYTKYFKPEQLLEKILQRFGMRTPVGLSVCEKLAYISQVRQTIRSECVRFIVRWLRCYPEDFSQYMTRKVAALAAAIEITGACHLANEINETLDTLGFDIRKESQDDPTFPPRRTVKTMGEMGVFRKELSPLTNTGEVRSYAYRQDTEGISKDDNHVAIQTCNSLASSGPPIPAMAMFGYQEDYPTEAVETENLVLNSPFSAYNNQLNGTGKDLLLTEPRPLCPFISLSTADSSSPGRELASKLAGASSIISLPPELLAHHIGYVMYEAFMNIHPREMPGQRQTKLTRQPQIRLEIPNLALLIDRHNALSSWVTANILESMSEYSKRLDLFIRTAHELYRTKQFESAVSVYSAATSTAVTRINSYKVTITANPTIERMAQELDRFIDVSGNMANYKKEWESLGVSVPCVPYIGATLRQVTLIEDTMAGSDGCYINFGRMCHVYNCVYYFLRHQLGPQNRFVVRQDLVDSLVKSLVKIDTDELWAQSYRLQPRT